MVSMSPGKFIIIQCERTTVDNHKNHFAIEKVDFFSLCIHPSIPSIVHFEIENVNIQSLEWK